MSWLAAVMTPCRMLGKSPLSAFEMISSIRGENRFKSQSIEPPEKDRVKVPI
jgi:hypothetical protein